MPLTIEEVIERAGAPSSLPDIVIRLNELISNPKSSASDIGHVIEQDPALSARLLKIVNSPYYGFPSSIDTISRAITIIGIHDLRDLILATTTVNVFSDFSREQFDPERFWNHSLYCALIARILADKANHPYTERFFVAGLLHDIGSLVLHQALPEEVDEIIRLTREKNATPCSVEFDALGFTHADVGAALAKKWNLPPHLVETIAYHHEPASSENCKFEASIVHIANFLANGIEDDSNISGILIPTKPESWEITGLDMDTVNEALGNIKVQFAQMHRILFPQYRAA